MVSYVRHDISTVLFILDFFKFPLYAKGEERVVGRSKDRVSINEAVLTLMHWRTITHPDIVTLVDPLFAARKEGKSHKAITLYNTYNAC